MGKLICIIGKSGSGKDTLYKNIISDPKLRLMPVTPYTTRPKRKEETDGEDYHFVTLETMKAMEAAGEIIEKRVYHTVHGDWFYFTRKFELQNEGKTAAIITTPAAFLKLAEVFGNKNLIIVYLDTDDKTRLERSVNRESEQPTPNYQEVCRRFLADEKDFAFIKTEDWGSYCGYYRIDSGKSIDDCKRQFEEILRGVDG
ncbi:MAG: guanylate kinase [Ruminococcus sp.]|nr:guanylate kinase [Ruminococcus sp.]